MAMELGERIRGAVRRSRRRLAYARASLQTARYQGTAQDQAFWEARLRRYRLALRQSYPHLSGDLDADADVLRKAEALAKDYGRNFYITSGRRTHAEQLRLWNNRTNNPFPVAPPGTSRHEIGRALDILVDGRPIQDVVPAELIRKHGLSPLPGDAAHVEG
jgi:N-acetylmuramoyl-L-alanine amidase